MKWPVVTVLSLKSEGQYSLVGGPFGSNLTTRDYKESGVPVIRGANMSETACFSEDDFVFVSESKADELRPNNAFKGDLVFTQRGTLGQVGLIPHSSNFDRYVISQSQMKLTVDPERVNAKFVYYYFRSPSTVQNVKNRAITSGVPHINLGILREFLIPLPPLSIQKDIVAILDNYDDLIENNRRRIQLLEESARLLYKEWFVHLRFPGHEHVKLTVRVPQGWRKGRVEDFYSTGSGGTPSRTNPAFFEGTINWVKTQELVQSFIFSTDEKITEDALSQSSAKLFPEGSVLVAMYGATIGQASILAAPASSNQACCAVMPREKGTHSAHAYLFFRESQHLLVNLGQGSAQKNISQQVIRAFDMMLPPPLLLSEFIDYVDPTFRQIKTLLLANAKLTQARDLLLPRLMSGELAA